MIRKGSVLLRLARPVVAAGGVAALLVALARLARQLRSGELLIQPIRHPSERLQLQWRESDSLMHSPPLLAANSAQSHGL